MQGVTLEVIGAGFGRTGTLSLKTALERLGFAPCYHMSSTTARSSARVRARRTAGIGATRFPSVPWAGYVSGMASDDRLETSFTRMMDATREDYAVIARHALGFTQGLPDRILRHLALLAGDTGGYAVDRLTHSLQTATRAHRDGRDEEYVVCALVHDIGDTLASLNHAELAAVIVEPFVSEENHWIVKHHGIFQGYYFFHHLGLDRNMRDRYRDHPHWQACTDFCAAYDQNSFDPGYDTSSLEFFEPMVRRVFAAPKRSLYLPNEG